MASLKTFDIRDLPNILRSNPIILEIGSNRGKDTNRFLNIFQSLTLYCFEPDPRCLSNKIKPLIILIWLEMQLKRNMS